MSFENIQTCVTTTDTDTQDVSVTQIAWPFAEDPACSPGTRQLMPAFCHGGLVRIS